MSKKCTACKLDKPSKAFNKRGDGIGFRSKCIPCVKISYDLKKVSKRKKPFLTVEERRTNILLSYKKHNATRKAYNANREAARRAAKILATPKWLKATHLDAIKFTYRCREFFSKEFKQTLHVDHIIPLKGKEVCGLHVPWNMQLLDAVSNSKKSNKLEYV